jgi:hypothetical protein
MRQVRFADPKADALSGNDTPPSRSPAARPNNPAIKAALKPKSCAHNSAGATPTGQAPAGKSSSPKSAVDEEEEEEEEEMEAEEKDEGEEEEEEEEEEEATQAPPATNLPWSKMQRKLKRLAASRVVGIANIHIKGPTPLAGAYWSAPDLLEATKASLSTAKDTRMWANQQRIGVFAKASRQEIWSKCKTGLLAINGRQGLVTTCHPKPGNKGPVLTRTVWEVSSHKWPLGRPGELASTLRKRRAEHLATYQTALAKNSLRIIFEDPSDLFSKDYLMPSKLNGGATGYCFVLSDASELNDASEVCDRFGKEAGTVGLTIRCNELATALRLMKAETGHPSNLLLLHASDMDDTVSMDRVFTAALDVEVMRKWYPFLKREPVMWESVLKGERVFLLSLEASMSEGAQFLRDLQRGSPKADAVPTRWNVHPSDASGLGDMCKQLLSGRFSPTSENDWEKVLASLIANDLMPIGTTKLGHRLAGSQENRGTPKHVSRTPKRKYTKVPSAKYTTESEDHSSRSVTAVSSSDEHPKKKKGSRSRGAQANRHKERNLTAFLATMGIEPEEYARKLATQKKASTPIAKPKKAADHPSGWKPQLPTEGTPDTPASVDRKAAERRRSKNAAARAAQLTASDSESAATSPRRHLKATSNADGVTGKLTFPEMETRMEACSAKTMEAIASLSSTVKKAAERLGRRPAAVAAPKAASSAPGRESPPALPEENEPPEEEEPEAGTSMELVLESGEKSLEAFLRRNPRARDTPLTTVQREQMALMASFMHDYVGGAA